MSPAAPNQPVGISDVPRARPEALRRGVVMLRPLRCAGKAGRRPNRAALPRGWHPAPDRLRLRRHRRGRGRLRARPRSEGVLRRGPGAAVDARLGDLGRGPPLRRRALRRVPRVGGRPRPHHRPPVRLVLDDPRAARRRGRAAACSGTPRRTSTTGPRCPARRRSCCCSPARCSAWSAATTCFLLFMFWELTSITSFLLIGTERRERRRPVGRPPGPAGHRRRRPGDARRVRAHRPGGRHVLAARDPHRARRRAPP